MKAKLTAILLVIFLSACTTMSKEKCQGQDWQLYASQKFSNSPASFSSINSMAHEACKEHGISPTLEELKAGYIEGIKSYCTPRNIWERTLKGEDVVINYCPASVRANLKKVSVSAKDVYHLEQLEEEIVEKQNSLNTLQHEMYRIESDLQAKYAARAPQHEIDSLIASLNSKRAEILNAQNDLSQKHLKASQLRRRANKYQRYN
tara:strand:- start:4566 stop:5180 length:615 start_codon:yes stop_codon:yes gene_type:complete